MEEKDMNLVEKILAILNMTKEELLVYDNKKQNEYLKKKNE